MLNPGLKLHNEDYTNAILSRQLYTFLIYSMFVVDNSKSRTKNAFYGANKKDTNLLMAAYLQSSLCNLGTEMTIYIKAQSKRWTYCAGVYERRESG